MRRAAVSAVLGLLLVAAVSHAGKERFYAPGAPPPMPLVAEQNGDADTERLIQQLGADDWHAREQAGRDLAAKGERALPFLRRALARTDNPEVQRRLSVLVKKMDYERLTAAKTVTLNVKDKRPGEVFEEIARQTGYRIEFGDQGAGGRYTFAFDKVPFWQAVDAVANAVGHTVQTNYDDDVVRVYNQDATNPHVSYAGPYRALATNISLSRNVQLAGVSRRGDQPRANESISLSFQINSEPKNPMLAVGQPELLSAVDERGGSLVPPQERNDYGGEYRSGYYGRGGRSYNQSFGVALARADRGATTIKSLKVKVRVELLSGTAPEIVVADPLKVKEKTFPGRSVDLDVKSVEAVPNNEGMFVVSLTARSRTPADPRRGDDYGWANSLPQRFELIDEKGVRYFSYGMQSSNYTPGGFQTVLAFGTEDRRTGRPGPKPGPPARLVLNEWLTATQDVTFEFKDIPLP